MEYNKLVRRSGSKHNTSLRIGKGSNGIATKVVCSTWGTLALFCDTQLHDTWVAFSH